MTIQATDTDFPPGADGSPSRPAGPIRRWLNRTVKAVAALIFVGSFGVWVYAYSGRADRPAPDLFDRSGFAQQAEAICAATVADLAALPNALTAADPTERADQIRVATARLEQMVADLDAATSGSERDVDIIGEWLDDWRVLLGDRYRYAQALIDDPQGAQYLLTDTGIGERLDRRIDRLATTNGMLSCRIPGDV